MNKSLYYIRNTLFLINIAIFTCCSYGITSLGEFSFIILAPFIIALILLTIWEAVKKKDYVNLNRLYNITFIIAMIFILIVLLRNKLDNALVVNDMASLLKDSSCLSYIFVSSNLLYFIIIAGGLVTYNILLLTSKKRK